MFIGFFSTSAVNPLAWEGVIYGGGFAGLRSQAISAGTVFLYSFTVALILGFAIEKTIGFRIARDAEIEGIDLTEHAESGYEFENRGAGGFGSVLSGSAKEGA